MSRVHSESPFLLVGDFNARTGSRVPALEAAEHPPRRSADSTVCPRGEWLLDLCGLFGLYMLNG